MEHDARVERDQPLRRGEQRIDVDLGNAPLLGDQHAEAHQQLLERCAVDRPPAPYAGQRGSDLGALDHAPRKGGGQRWQGQRPIAEELDQLAAGAEQQHRTELRIGRRADDQLVAGVVDHGLDGDALEVLGAPLLGHRGADRLERAAYRVVIDQVELNTADVGLVADRVAVELDHDRVADRPRGGHRGVRISGHARLGDGHAVRGEHLLRFRPRSAACGPRAGRRR